MAAMPDVEYAHNGDTRLAYQVWGSGPEVLVVPGLFSNVEMTWEHEYYRRVLEWFGEHARVAHFDKRGMGLSDRSDVTPTLDDLMGDIAAVLDALGWEAPAVVGVSEGGVMSQYFAARQPERVSRLALANSAAGGTIHLQEAAAGLPALLEFFEGLYPRWGQDATYLLERFAPGRVSNTAFVRWLERFQRQSCSAADLRRHVGNMLQWDAYELLGGITVPTLVASCSDDLIVPAATGDALAAAIPGAERYLFDGGDHFYWIGEQWLEVSTPLLEFLTGAAATVRTERGFGAVVFTDIVGSTTSAVTAGDEQWRRLLDDHDQAAWRLIDRHGGTIVKSTGDGLLARFAMPSDAVLFTQDLRNELDGVGLPIRAGIHVGEIEIRSDGDLTGFAVNLAARVEQAADDGAVFVSSTVRDMMQGGSVEFADRGSHELKGFDDTWRLFEVVG